MVDNYSVSRRTALKVTGGTLATLTASGISAAKPDKTVEVNVGFANENGRKAALNAASNVSREFGFDALTLQVPEQAVSGLKNNPNVRYVEENGTWQAFQTLPWGVNRVDADRSWTCSQATYADVAIIDTGIDADHPDLQPNLGYGGSWVGSSWNDDNGHGTHCAGITGADYNSYGVVGVAPSVNLHAVKVLNSNGGGYWSDIAAGIEWTANQGFDVGSMSLGGGHSSVVQDAVQYAYNRGVLLVAAAGNNYGGSVSYPAAYGECIAVSSTDRYDNLSSFSNTGPQVELAAPGSSIYSTYVGGGYNTLSGTSMATPHVAGAGAMLMSNGYSHTGARNRLQNTAEWLSGLSSYEQGYGLLDVEAALGC